MGEALNPGKLRAVWAIGVGRNTAVCGSFPRLSGPSCTRLLYEIRGALRAARGGGQWLTDAREDGAQRDDQWHSEASATLPMLIGRGVTLVTTNLVVGETYSLLRRTHDHAALPIPQRRREKPATLSRSGRRSDRAERLRNPASFPRSDVLVRRRNAVRSNAPTQVTLGVCLRRAFRDGRFHADPGRRCSRSSNGREQNFQRAPPPSASSILRSASSSASRIDRIVSFDM